MKAKENGFGMIELISTIKDTGIGMTEEKLSNVFESMGLSIVKTIVELMQGDISITSQESIGTTVKFSVFLKSNAQSDVKGPETKEINSTIENIKKEKFDFSGKTILLFEDIEINREIVQFLLEDTGVTCVEAADGIEGLKLYNKEPEKYDLILMDIQMPNMDGFEATQRIREGGMPNSKKIPIVAMTANVFASQVQDILSAGMNAHLGKPIDEMTMKRELAKYI